MRGLRASNVAVFLAVVAVVFFAFIALKASGARPSRVDDDRLSLMAANALASQDARNSPNYPSPFPQWPNALALTTSIDPVEAAQNIKSYDGPAQRFYLRWKPDFANVWGGVQGWNGPNNFVNSSGAGDGFYIASSKDPTYELTCVREAYCGFSNHIIGLHIPDGARTQNSGGKSCDCHLYVLEPVGWIPQSSVGGIVWPNVAPNRYEIDLENATNSESHVNSPDADSTTFAGGGAIYAVGGAAFSTGSTGWYGGVTKLNDGFHPANAPPVHSWGGSATHGNSPYTAMTITAQDYIAGAIKHEMFMDIVCAEDPQPDSWPASVEKTDYSCSDLGGSGWSYGDHIWLKMSDSEIDASTLTPVQRIFAKGLAHYGAVILDVQRGWGPTFHVNITSGDPNWAIVAKMYNLQSGEWSGIPGFHLNMGLPFTLLSNLHAINSCVIQHTCRR